MELFQVIDHPEESRYEVRVDSAVAFLAYEKKENQTIFLHTEVPQSLESKGIGSALARQALADAVDEKRWLIPLCPFVRGYLLRHPDLQDVPAYYQLLAAVPEPVQDLLVRARSLVVDTVPERVVEIPLAEQLTVGYAEKGGKFTDNLCWFRILPDGLALHFNEDIDLSHREDLPDDYLPIQTAEDLQSPTVRSLILAAWEAVE